VTESEGDAPIKGALLDEAYLKELGLLEKVPAWAEVVKELRQEA
jgi:hypothetical protein